MRRFPEVRRASFFVPRWKRDINLLSLPLLEIARAVGCLGYWGWVMSKTVLAVDDSLVMRMLLRRALGEQGFAVHLAEDGIAALEWLAVNESPDVMITDINMPRMDGFGLVEAVRARDAHRDMPILVLSTESSDDKQSRATAAGASGWLVKPFDPASLAAAIERVSP